MQLAATVSSAAVIIMGAYSHQGPMVHLDARLISHPKMQRAGELLGEFGIARAFTLFAVSIGYAREYLTDGKVPDTFVKNYPGDPKAKLVARVLSDRRVKLWHRTKGGYQIHDYLDWNRQAADVKEVREKERLRAAAYRASKKNGQRRRK